MNTRKCGRNDKGKTGLISAVLSFHHVSSIIVQSGKQKLQLEEI